MSQGNIALILVTKPILNTQKGVFAYVVTMVFSFKSCLDKHLNICGQNQVYQAKNTK